jgi:molybdenum cofactor biosynthesis protein B
MIPGFGELFRARSLASVGLAAIQSRACAAVVRGAYVFALPGTPAACADAWEIIGPLLDSRTEPGNLARLIPRLTER